MENLSRVHLTEETGEILSKNSKRMERKMKAIILKKAFVLMVLAVFLLQVSVSSASDTRWRNGYDDMPGEEVDVGKILLIGAGIAAAVTVVALVVKSGKNSDSNKDSMESSEEEESEDINEANFDKGRIKRSLEAMNFESANRPYYSLYLDLGKGDKISKLENDDLGLSNVMLKAGLSYNF